MNRILVIAAHPDDELLGVGGTIRRLVNEGNECRALIIGEGITSRANTRIEADKEELIRLRNNSIKASKIIGFQTIDFCSFPDNRLDSVDLLDVIKTITYYVDKYNPDIIFTHHFGDLNIDHQIVCRSVLTACRPVEKCNVKKIYAFETPSSTEWNYAYEKSFIPNAYFDVSETFDYKIKGMECYESESACFPHPRSSESLTALAKYRGSNVGCSKAEAFMIMLEINK